MDVGVDSNPLNEPEPAMLSGEVGGSSRPSTMKEGGPITAESWSCDSRAFPGMFRVPNGLGDTDSR